MRWPWVLRSEYDRVEADRGSWHEAFDRMLVQWQNERARAEAAELRLDMITEIRKA